jgi:myo-inositol 2-dehydrogenase/D-chiro-inositol 1-dehydrogenase
VGLKIGLIGGGFMSGVHRGNLDRDDRVEVCNVYDIDPARAGALAVASVDELLDKSDAVYIVSPNTTHVETALKALAADRHVFCEKPMATTLEDAQRLHEAATASSKVFQVGYNRRFAPVYKQIKQLLEASPAHCAHIKMNRGELLNPAWVGDATVTGGFLFETPIHMFDMMRFLMGEIASVQARESRQDDFSMLVEFESGVHATFVTSADTSWFFPYESVEIYGVYSTIRTEEMEKIEWRSGLDVPTSVENFANLTREEKWGFAEGDRLFVDAILARGEPPVTSYDGLKSVEMTMAVYRSAKEKTAVRLEL